MNSVIISGRVASDINFRITKKGIGVANFLFAVPNRTKKRNEDGSVPTDFPKIVAWGKIGEICRDYLIKGRECIIHGTVTTERYEKNNKKFSDTFITAQVVEFSGYQKQIGDENEISTDKNTNAETSSEEIKVPMNHIPDEELPF